jgi:hypothetical protein
MGTTARANSARGERTWALLESGRKKLDAAQLPAVIDGGPETARVVQASNTEGRLVLGDRLNRKHPLTGTE